MLKKLPTFLIILFLSTWSGCGDDDGGGGNGNNKSGPSTPKKTPPVRKIGTHALNQISSGGDHSCVLTDKGKVICWGQSIGQLPYAHEPINDGNGNDYENIVQVSSGNTHACILTPQSQVMCWGVGSHGRLGNGGSTDAALPVNVVDGDQSIADLTDIIQIGAGYEHTCAVTSKGGVKCWGRGEKGQLGNNETTSKEHPVDVVTSETDPTPLSGITQVWAGRFHTCALTLEGRVKCWGNGGVGQLGNGLTGDHSYPQDVVLDENGTPLADIIQIGVGSTHSCAVTMGGGVKCWGYGANGQLGDGDTATNLYPEDVVTEEGSTAPLLSIVHVSAKREHSCALTTMGGVKCWGKNDYGQLGNGSTSNVSHPVDVIAEEGSPFALSGITHIDSGRQHVCALTDRGEIRCWGDGTDSQLGYGLPTGVALNDLYPRHAPIAVVANEASTIRLKTGQWRREYACFSDGSCQLDPDTLIRPVLTGAREGASATPEVKVLGVEEDEEITLHLYPDCSGESIGGGTVAAEADEITITPTTDLAAKENRIYAKAGEFCSQSGVDYTYTGGTDRIVGDGEAVSTDRTPTLTVNLLSTGDEVSIHKSADCSDTALASGTATGASLDVTLDPLESGGHTLYLKQNELCHLRGFDYKLVNYIGESSRVVGGEDFACAVSNAGGVKCWGEGSYDRLGNGATADTDAPDDVGADSSNTLTGIAQIASGEAHTCGLTSGGNVVCWGSGDNGRLGNDCDSSCTSQAFPVYVKSAEGSSTNLSDIVQVKLGSKHTCALTSSGGVKCWGPGSYGRLGNNSTANSDVPVDVVTSNTNTDPLTGIVQISAGDFHVCALTSGGNVKCWGYEANGELGNDCNTSCPSKSYPVDVVSSDGNSSLLSGIVQISSGAYHTCALTTGGNVVCWGAGGSGRLGNGSTTAVDAPVTVTTAGTTALAGIVGISMNGDHSCALKSIGGVVCWGEGDNGRLGNNTAGTDQGRPVDVLTSSGGNPALTNIAQIGLGEAHSCAVTTTGTVKCWGHGDVGQLGNDATNDSNLPVDVVDENGGTGTLNIGTKNRYACTDSRCGFID